MSNKQKQNDKSFENRSGQNRPQSGKNQEIPDYGTKSQNQKPEMEKDHRSGRC